jgi:hypothetical protein
MAQSPPATNICCSLPFCSHTLLLDPIMEMAKRAAYSTAVPAEDSVNNRFTNSSPFVRR